MPKLIQQSKAIKSRGQPRDPYDRFGIEVPHGYTPNAKIKTKAMATRALDELCRVYTDTICFKS